MNDFCILFGVNVLCRGFIHESIWIFLFSLYKLVYSSIHSHKGIASVQYSLNVSIISLFISSSESGDMRRFHSLLTVNAF